MKWLNTLRARLLATYLGLIILGFGGLTLLAGWQIANSAYSDFASTLQVNAMLLAGNLAGPLHDADDHGFNSRSVTEVIRRTAEGLQARVLLLDREERVLLDSQGTSMAPQRQRAFESSGFGNQNSSYFFAIDENRVTQMVVTVPVRGEERLTGYLQLAASVAQPQAMVRQRWLALGGGFLLFALVGFGVSLWLLSTLTKPLSALRDTALTMAAGDLTQRVAKPGSDEIGAVATAFNQMAERVEAMVAEQRAFAGNASHELRTPLTTLRLRTEALLHDELDPATTHQYIAEIDREVTHMSGLVDDLILLSRLDAHRLAVGEERVDVGRVLRSVQQELKTLIDTKALTIRVEPPPTPLSPVQANLNHLRVVVRNLLENGVKYTPSGGMIMITLTAGEGVAEDGLLRCTFRDNGVGIAPDELPHVRKRFHRAALARQRQQYDSLSPEEQQDGAGLGLALVDSIVALYGGRLEITSAGLGEGTTVTVWWPFVQQQNDEMTG